MKASAPFLARAHELSDAGKVDSLLEVIDNLLNSSPGSLRQVGELLATNHSNECYDAPRREKLEKLLARVTTMLKSAAPSAADNALFFRLRLKHADILEMLGRSRTAASLRNNWLRRAPKQETSPSGDRFRVMFKLRRYREAFTEGEALLDRYAPLGDGARKALSWPWRNVQAENFERLKGALSGELAALRKLLDARPESVWALFYSGVILQRCGDAVALDALVPLIKRGRGRYDWMWFEIGRAKLFGMDFRGARDAFVRARDAVPPIDWRTLAYLGEAYMCLGEPRRALEQFSRSEKDASPSRLGETLSWKGELLLWSGAYREASRTLDRAIELDAPYAHCWRGASAVCLGRPADALAHLDAAIRLKPQDLEARIWRGEANRLLGDTRAALSDLDYVLDRSHSIWALINRALLRAADGDRAAMIRDCERIPMEMIERGKSGPGAKPAERLRRLLRLAKGFRRDEAYAQAVWTRNC